MFSNKLLTLLLIQLPLLATNSLTQSNGASATASNASPITCTLSSTVAAGDLVIIGGRFGNTTAVMTITDGAGNSYTQFTASPLTSTADAVFAFFAKNTTSQSSLVITVTPSTPSGSHTTTIGCFDYASTTGWVGTQDQSSSNGQQSSNVTAGDIGAITPSSSGQLIWGVIEWDTAGPTGATGSGGCTERDAGGTAGTGFGSANRSAGVDLLNATTSATTCGWTWSTTSTHYEALGGSFKPSAAAKVCTLAAIGVGC